MRNILAICGSTRRQSVNLQILHILAAWKSEEWKVHFADITALPHFNPDLDHEAPAAAVLQFREQIQKADGILICTPEYVFSLPGSLKNALEWNIGTTLFEQKPVATITASGMGENAHASLLLILKTMGAQVPEFCQLHISNARMHVQSGLIVDTKTEIQLQSLAQAFASLVESVRKS